MLWDHVTSRLLDFTEFLCMMWSPLQEMSYFINSWFMVEGGHVLQTSSKEAKQTNKVLRVWQTVYFWSYLCICTSGLVFGQPVDFSLLKLECSLAKSSSVGCYSWMSFLYTSHQSNLTSQPKSEKKNKKKNSLMWSQQIFFTSILSVFSKSWKQAAANRHSCSTQTHTHTRVHPALVRPHRYVITPYSWT